MYEATRAAGFGPEVKRRIMIGTYVLSAGYLRRLFQPGAEGPRPDRPRFRRASGKAATSSSPRPRPAPPSASARRSADPIAMYLNDVFAVPASLAGLPAISVPAGLDGQGLPLGLQIIGKALDEQAVLERRSGLRGARRLHRSARRPGGEPAGSTLGSGATSRLRPSRGCWPASHSAAHPGRTAGIASRRGHPASRSPASVRP